MYKLTLSRHEKRKLLRLKWVILFLALAAVVLVVWLAWIRPMQKPTTFKSFEECVAAGNPVQESYPEVCLTKDGQRYVNTKQSAAHEASLAGEQELVPPSDPALLKLEIDEWDIRIPLTVDTFDLVYAYIESGGEESVLFTYKRLVNLGVCKGDMGLTLEDALTKLDAGLSFWQGTSTLGLIHDGAIVSCNALDVALGFCNQLPFAERIVHFVRDNLWHELMMQYLNQENLEAAVHRQLAGELVDANNIPLTAHPSEET